MRSITDLKALLEAILRDRVRRTANVARFQALVWDVDDLGFDPELENQLRDLAYDMDYYQPDEAASRAEDSCFFGDSRLERMVEEVLAGFGTPVVDTTSLRTPNKRQAEMTRERKVPKQFTYLVTKKQLREMVQAVESKGAEIEIRKMGLSSDVKNGHVSSYCSTVAVGFAKAEREEGRWRITLELDAVPKSDLAVEAQELGARLVRLVTEWVSRLTGPENHDPRDRRCIFFWLGLRDEGEGDRWTEHRCL